MMVGEWDSSAAHLSWKVGEESKTSWVMSSLSSNSRIWAQMSWTSGRSFWYSSKRALLRSALEGPVDQAVSLSLAPGSFCTLDGVAPSLEPLTVVSWLHFRRVRGSLTLRLRGGSTSSGTISSALPELVSEAVLPGSRTCRQGCEALGVGSIGLEASGSDPLSLGPGRVSTASRGPAKGDFFGTTGGLTASNTALAILGMKSGSVKGGGIRSCHLLWGSSRWTGSRLGGSSMGTGTFAPFCSICKRASPTAVDQAHLAPSWDDEGGSLSLVAVIPRLPNNPSKTPGKKLLSRGLSAAKPTRTCGATSE